MVIDSKTNNASRMGEKAQFPDAYTPS